eukprot:5233417-Prymnesium_polylepis.1
MKGFCCRSCHECKCGAPPRADGLLGGGATGGRAAPWRADWPHAAYREEVAAARASAASAPQPTGVV